MKTYRPKLLLDSNVLTDGLISRFGQSKAVLALCTAKTCRLVLPEIVRIEVERNFLKLADRIGDEAMEQIIDDFKGFLLLARPIHVPLADGELVGANRTLIRHLADVPVVLAAIESQPDWLITRNRDHFTDRVAVRIGIRIASPNEFFDYLVGSFNPNARND
jgi:predicted nucleic acid-binding protein